MGMGRRRGGGEGKNGRENKRRRVVRAEVNEGRGKRKGGERKAETKGNMSERRAEIIILAKLLSFVLLSANTHHPIPLP